jgi:hypothetical protein
MTSHSLRPSFIPSFFIIVNLLNHATTRFSTAWLVLRWVER